MTLALHKAGIRIIMRAGVLLGNILSHATATTTRTKSALTLSRYMKPTPSAICLMYAHTHTRSWIYLCAFTLCNPNYFNLLPALLLPWAFQLLWFDTFSHSCMHSHMHTRAAGSPHNRCLHNLLR